MMKLALLLLSLSCLPATAQRKLWTWSETADPDMTGSSFLANASDLTGNTALVLGEVIQPAEDPATWTKRARLLWISAKGVVLHEEVFPIQYEHFAAVLGAEKLTYPWSVISISSNTWIVTDGKRIWSGVLKGKAAVVSVRDLPNGTDIAPASSISPFPGWFERQSIGPWEFIYPTPPNENYGTGESRTGFRRYITGFSLWKAK